MFIDTRNNISVLLETRNNISMLLDTGVIGLIILTFTLFVYLMFSKFLRVGKLYSGVMGNHVNLYTHNNRDICQRNIIA